MISGIAIPPRAAYLRVIANELDRMQSHLLANFSNCYTIEHETLGMYLLDLREQVMDELERLTGARVTCAYIFPGGVRCDISRPQAEVLQASLDRIEKDLHRYSGMFAGGPMIALRSRGVGILTQEAAQRAHVVGPTARASDIRVDCRLNHPTYQRLGFEPVSRPDCDNFARIMVRFDEVFQSIGLIRKCLKELPPGMIRGGIVVAPVALAQQAPPAAAPAAAATDCPQCPVLALVPRGAYRMGSTPDVWEVDGATGETPAVNVSIGRPFYVGAREVTVGEFRRFVADSGYEPPLGCRVWRRGQWVHERDRSWRDPGFAQPPAEGDPVVCVNWDDARAYAEWLAQKSGRRYRLPSEAEWEYIARGGTAFPRYWGDATRTRACRSRWRRDLRHRPAGARHLHQSPRGRDARVFGRKLDRTPHACAPAPHQNGGDPVP